MVMNKKSITAVIALLLAIGGMLCIGGADKAYAAESDYPIAAFGAHCSVYGGGYENAWFDEEQTPNPELVYYWTRARQGLDSGVMDLDEFVDAAGETFVNCDDLRDWLIGNADSNKDFGYDEDAQEITLQPIYGGGGDSVNLICTGDDTWEGSGEVWCSWMDGSDLLQRAVLVIEDGAIVSFLPEEKVYQINVSEGVFDDTLRGLPGETLTIHAAAVDYYQSDMIENPLEGAVLRWSLAGKVLAENAESVDVELPNKEAREELLIEAFCLGQGREMIRFRPIGWDWPHPCASSAFQAGNTVRRRTST